MAEGLGDVVVVRVERIDPIEGADRIRLVVVDDGRGPVEVVCGAWNFEVGDLVPLAPVGAVLPGGFAIGRRKMKGVTSNGMLCSGRELRVSEDHEGILRLNEVDGAAPGLPLTEALGVEPDVVCDIAVEANRPDAWCMAGVARDLAARLGLPFAMPGTARLVRTVTGDAGGPPARAGRAARGHLASDAGRRPRPAARASPPGCGHRRTRWAPSPGLAGPPAHPGRHAAHQQCGRRLQLRDAGAGPAHPPLRPRPASRSRTRGPTGGGRGDPWSPRSTGWSGRSGCPGPGSATPGRTASSATPRDRRWASAA